MQARPCAICTGSHSVGRCPDLWNPLKEGFFEGGGSGGGHSHDDDEKVDAIIFIENELQDSIKTIESSRNDRLCNLLRCDHRGHGPIRNELRS